MLLGIERLLNETALQQRLHGKSCALVGHPASVTHDLTHSLDALMQLPALRITAAFGPQHGMRGDKQDNMIESPDYFDPEHDIPVFSLYGDTRRPTESMMQSFDLLLFDVQDLGCRIYTYITTLLYLMEACATHRKPLWILDRPNPAGRNIEGTLLEPGWESFVGAGPLIMRHGLTVGEIARWFQRTFRLDLELEIITMQDYDPRRAPGYGWPLGELCWVNPSPNASSVNMARCFPGTVLLEGTTLSEGRGTTVALELLGAPGLEIKKILQTMESLAPQWLAGVRLRPCFFEPTFHKHQGRLCHGIQLHTDCSGCDPQRFQPYRLVILFLKALRRLSPDYELWRYHDYEYESERAPIDLINGGTFVREWIEDDNAGIADLEDRLRHDEAAWADQIQDLLLYP